MPGSEALTRGIRVEVEAHYSPDHSHPGSQWFFLYTVTISNEGDDTVQLISRHWIITDGAGQVEEVEGPGVVGAEARGDGARRHGVHRGPGAFEPPRELAGEEDVCRLRTPVGAHRPVVALAL